MPADQVEVLLVGVLSVPLGIWLHRVGQRAHDEARARSSDFALRMDLKATEIIGMVLTIAGAAAIVGTLLGVVLWGDRGEPSWPW